MKANELMIGDWITFADTQNEKNPVLIKIRQLNASGEALVSIENDESLDIIDIANEVVGIPLTSEILEKNGFIKTFDDHILSMYHGLFQDSHIHITIASDGKFAVEIHNTIAGKDEKGRTDSATFARDWCNTFYVHELQHALRLCGIDKDIVI